MLTVDRPDSRVISRCHGYDVLGRDGPVGVVETPLFPPDCHDPDYLVVRVHTKGRLFPRFPLVPASLVAEVREEEGWIRVDATRVAVERLPDRVPLATT
jgi:hypothetical protein